MGLDGMTAEGAAGIRSFRAALAEADAEKVAEAAAKSVAGLPDGRESAEAFEEAKETFLRFAEKLAAAEEKKSGHEFVFFEAVHEGTKEIEPGWFDGEALRLCRPDSVRTLALDGNSDEITASVRETAAAARVPVSYALGFAEWAEVLGSGTDAENLSSVGTEACLAAALVEMAEFGTENEDAKLEEAKLMEERAKRAEEIAALPLEEAVKFMISADEVKKRLGFVDGREKAERESRRRVKALEGAMNFVRMVKAIKKWQAARGIAQD